MDSIQHKRREAMLFRTIAEIVTEELHNSKISYPTVTGVKLSNDGSHLNIYVTFEKNIEKSFEAINKTNGFIRKRISNLPNLRKVPEVHFVIDNSAQEGNKIERILKEIKEKEK